MMNNTEIQQTAISPRIQSEICNKALSLDLSSDYSLPDYQAEIRKILRVSASPLPPSKYVNGSSAELCGTIDYRILYIGSDSNIYSCDLAADYSFTAPLDIANNIDLGEGIAILCDISCENLTARVSAPRKLSVKCRLGAKLRAYGTAVLDTLISGECQESSIERLNAEADSLLVLSALGDINEQTAEFSLPTASTRVIDAYADAYAVSVTPQEGYADCEAEISLRLLVCDDGTGGTPSVLSRNISIKEIIDCDRLTPDCKCAAKFYVSELKVSVEENRIVCTIGIAAELVAHKKETAVYTRDMYSTENSVETAEKKITVNESLSCFNSNFSQSERLTLEDSDVQKGAAVISCRAEASADECVYNSGKYMLCGQCRFFVLAQKDGEYIMTERNVPFKYSFAASEPHSDFYATVTPMSASARIDGNNLALDCELSVCAELSRKKEFTLLSEARFGEKLSKDQTPITVCYPSNEDTLWSISKRYAVPLITHRSVSSPTGTLEGIDYILVNS